jgi:hypothetical protein
MPLMRVLDQAEFWDDLLAFIEKREVIPVVGAELLTIVEDGATIPLYHCVANTLLKRYGLGPLDQPAYGLFEAVAALASTERRLRDLYRPVHGILQRVTAEHPEAGDALRELAAVRDFQLFVTTTPDDLLVRAVDQTRFAGLRHTHEIEYAPRLPTNPDRDLREPRPSGYTGVFYLLGKADVAPFFAIHEEDALEFTYTFQRGSGSERVLAEMRQKNLLLIGCTFADWLNRFFLRLSNNDRLSSDQRLKKEYLVGTGAGRDSEFVVFLERFSQDSRFLSADPRAFVSELVRRWLDRNPSQSAEASGMSIANQPTNPAGEFFISYASQDIGAARALFADLRNVSGGVAWFDKDQLTPGAEWNLDIRSAIQRCTFFVALISKNTERRDEGHFRREWALALERSQGITGRKFIFPVVIDPSYDDAPDRYRLVPDSFKALHYAHAPLGQMSEALRRAFTEEIRAVRRLKQ